MRTGIFGGTFDPVHLGHLIIAGQVLEKFNLSEIRFVPAAQPWMKKGWEITSTAHRLKMLKLSLAGNPHFILDLTDIKREGPTYTIDTLRDMRNKLGPETELFFIMGADALKGFPLWKEPGEIVKVATLVVVPRPGYIKSRVSELEKSVPGIREKLVVLTGPRIGISARNIRKRVHEGRSIKDLVTPGVADYIQKNGLYL